jgi:hypothetical protein
VNGWRGNTSIEKRIEYDLYYIENWSVPSRSEDHVADAAEGFFTSMRTSARSKAALQLAGGMACAMPYVPHERLMKKRVVITGAAGFIGSHLAETLLDRDYSVVGIDNLLTGRPPNISHLVNRDFSFIKHDVTNYIYVDGPVDFVLHWASPASPIDYLELPIPDAEVGALGTHKALGPG